MAVKPELKDQVDADIAKKSEVTTQDMMGTTAYMVRGRMFAYWVEDGLVAKLNDRLRREFLDKAQGVEFQGPQARGNEDWMRLNLAKKADVEPALAAANAAYKQARGIEKKTPRSKSKKKRR